MDYDGTKHVNDMAFGQSGEGLLVEKLRMNPDFLPGLSIVAELDDQIVGHILFFPIKIKDAGKIHTSLALAPMSVLPEYQGQGIGAQMITAGLQEARQLGFRSVIVLGHPGYYPRFGFAPASKWDIKTTYAVPS